MTNLYEDKFQAALGGKEHRGFLTAFREGKVQDDVKSHVEDLQWCSGLVLCYPTWWYSFPAILKVITWYVNTLAVVLECYRVRVARYLTIIVEKTCLSVWN